MTLATAAAQGQSRKQARPAPNDANTALHLMAPDYPMPYGVAMPEQVKAKMDCILHYLQANTPAHVVDRRTGSTVPLDRIDTLSRVAQGSFRLTSYEWGVTYWGCLAAGRATADADYTRYATERMEFVARAADAFAALADSTGFIEPTLHPALDPRALDDCGAICSAMLMAKADNPKLDFGRQLDRYFDRVMYNEYRLSDGTLARCRPHFNTVWLDDFFMGVPAMALRGRNDREPRFTAEALRQAHLFVDKMMVPDKGLFRHGWVEGMAQHPSFYWARANGWAMLTLSLLTDVVSKADPQYPWLAQTLRTHIEAVAALQSPTGFWHQLLDRPETYLETSATAIYTYCIAHAINTGLIDAAAYGPVALLGWQALSTRINAQGQVEGTCVGTGMGFDAAFYAYRPQSAAAAHGYGPALLAGAEISTLLSAQYPQTNDAAVQFYNKQQATASPIFGVADPSRPAEMTAGSTRKGRNPVLFIIGDSTVKNGRGLGDGEMWGWASFFDTFVDADRISVENHALGGRSSRTFITEGLWSKVLQGIRPGDYLIVQFGHNDGGPLGTGRARASLRGTGYEHQDVTMERTGGTERVYTYGHYMRRYIREARARGANVTVLSHTPGNRWSDDGRINRCTDTYAAWTRDVALAEGVSYIDVNALAADAYDRMGREASKPYFKDNVHTSYIGAMLHGKCIARALAADAANPLSAFIDTSKIDRRFGIAPKPLYRDPEYDGAADPTIIYDAERRCHTMFYTNRRANLPEVHGVDWVHGTPIGIATSTDGGTTWTHAGYASFDIATDSLTLWAPDVVSHGGQYHMFVTVVPGIFTDWRHPRHIAHFVSTDLRSWRHADDLRLASDRVIDAGLFRDGDRWLMFYNNEAAGKSIYCAESRDLKTWTDLGPMVTDRGCEGPKVFEWNGRYMMIVDNWAGLAVYQSHDLRHWVRQPRNILQEPGLSPDDAVMGGHCDVVVASGRAYIFYFTHPGRTQGADLTTADSRRSSIQVAELQMEGGRLTCNRNSPAIVRLDSK